MSLRPRLAAVSVALATTVLACGGARRDDDTDRDTVGTTRAAIVFDGRVIESEVRTVLEGMPKTERPYALDWLCLDKPLALDSAAIAQLRTVVEGVPVSQRLEVFSAPCGTYVVLAPSGWQDPYGPQQTNSVDAGTGDDGDNCSTCCRLEVEATCANKDCAHLDPVNSWWDRNVFWDLCISKCAGITRRGERTSCNADCIQNGGNCTGSAGLGGGGIQTGSDGF